MVPGFGGDLDLNQWQRATLQGISDRLAAGARQRHDLAVELRCTAGDPVEVLQSYARTADLLITSQRDPARDGGLSTGQSARLLVGSACPVLTMPYVGLTAEATVSGESGPLLAAHLERHGVRALPTLLSQAEPTVGERMRSGAVPDVAVAEALLPHAVGVHADFIVMDGYGHSRLWELALGGVTRTMTVPLLMSY